jgi:hypothetical protein
MDRWMNKISIYNEFSQSSPHPHTLLLLRSILFFVQNIYEGASAEVKEMWIYTRRGNKETGFML